MPFKSVSQQKWMYANHPEMAKEWESHTPSNAALPTRVSDKKRTSDKKRAAPKGH